MSARQSSDDGSPVARGASRGVADDIGRHGAPVIKEALAASVTEEVSTTDGRGFGASDGPAVASVCL